MAYKAGTTMPHRQAGDLRVSAIGLACMGLDFPAGHMPDRREMGFLLHAAVERGVNFFDTAEAYGPLTNEQLLGTALAPFRHQVMIATKFGFRLGNGPRITGVDSRPQQIRKVAEQSLQHLGVEAIDLFYQHRVDPHVPVEDVAGTVQDLIREGKVKHFGLCTDTPEIIRRAHTVQKVTAVQCAYSVFNLVAGEQLLPLLEALGIGLVAYGEATFGGFDNGLFKPVKNRTNGALATLLTSIAEREQSSSEQIALAWLLARAPFIVPIPAATQLHPLEAHIGAAGIVLTPADMAAIEKVVTGINIQLKTA
jgi:aryl-alcohol dehydrogenase-like predicted oxidoreductase